MVDFPTSPTADADFPTADADNDEDDDCGAAGDAIPPNDDGGGVEADGLIENLAEEFDAGVPVLSQPNN